MKIIYLITLSFLLFSNHAIAQVGNTYVCEEKKVNKSGIKTRIILEWKKDEFEIRQEKTQLLVDGSGKNKFLISTPSYFLAMKKHREGHIIYSFDKNIYSTLYVSDGYTFFNEYYCDKF